MVDILLVDDNLGDRLLAIGELKRFFGSHLYVTEITGAEEFHQALTSSQFDVVITDYTLHWGDGLMVLRLIKDRYPDRPVIMFTNSGSQEIAVEAMKLGLDDYVIKAPNHYMRLPIATQVALERAAEKHKSAGLEVRLQSLLNQLEVGVYRMNGDGVLLEANPAFFRLLGLNAIPPSPLPAKALNDVTLQVCPTVLNQLHQHGDSREKELQLRQANGAITWLRISQSLSYSGKTLLIDGLIEDISDRKQAEHEKERFLAREQQARIDAEMAHQRSAFLAEASRLLATTLDHRTTLPQLAQLAIPTLADWCFIDVIENHVRNFRDPIVAAITPEKAALVLELRRRYPPPLNANFGAPKVLRTRESELNPNISQEMLLSIAQDEEHLQLLQKLGATSYMIVPLVARGQSIGTLAFALARSDRRYGQADLDMARGLAVRAALAIDNARLYQEARDANQMKDEFLAIVSHELRTPLNSILGWSQLLQTRQFDESARLKAIETIERNARAQSRLIDDILDVSRLIRGKLRLNLEPVPLLPIITMAIDDIRSAAQLKNLRIETSLDAAVGHVLGDAERLQQIIWNLLSNAVKFTPTGGHIWVHLERIRREVVNSTIRSQTPLVADLPSTLNASHYAHLVIQDTGQGISPDFLPFIFDRFRQADSTKTRSQSGLGLGLAIVRSLVEMHNGVVFAESSGEGKGSIFTVQLPLQDTPSFTTFQKSSMTNDFPDLSGLRILLVDDDADTRELVTFVLEQCHAEIMAVVSAQEGFAAIAQNPPDLLISDISMPDEDGYSLMRRIRAYEAEEGRRQIPAIALTAFARDEDRQAALAVGFQQYFAKPINPFDLVAVITTLVKAPETA
ncbi:MAG: response regulator [Oculatellaceae cyanobacterium bins.114]|nr:response regulator [Oculatellaceae cyanobacterium bins.114]